MKTSTSQPVILGKRRFACFSPNLVGLDFSPTGNFDDRPSIMVEDVPSSVAFESVTELNGWTILRTGFLEIRSRDNERPMTRKNLEIRWVQNGLLQFWRPGDRDNQNLGGTLRSLDRFGKGPGIEGTHVADMEHPDAKGLEWLSWLQDETDAEYYKASPDAPEGAGKGSYARMAAMGDHGGKLLERSMNAAMDTLKYGVGLLSRSGYFLLNDSEGAVLDDGGAPLERALPGYQKHYFFGYATDYKQALADFTLLCGRPSLPLRQCFGLNFSRWPAWKEPEAKELVHTFESKGYPLSVLVLDMEWHKEGWGHWDWDETFYPDPAVFFKWLHDKGMVVTLNDHPLMLRRDDSHFEDYVAAAGLEDQIREIDYKDKKIDAVPIDICNPRSAKAFLETCHKPFMDIGLDYWWNDGTIGHMDKTWGQLVGNRYFFQESERDGRRGMSLGRFGGWGNHRYGIFFTGDTYSCWDILGMQAEFNIRAGHVGMSNVSHDIGGFIIDGHELRKNGQGVAILDPLLYKRWLQFGVFNPILRLHSAPGSGSRQPWDYEDGPEDDSCARWLSLRNKLLPYFYTAARQHVDTGLPMTRGHFLDDSDNREAYRFDQYMLGDSLLVAPVLGPDNEREIYLPEGQWWAFQSTTRYTGGVTIRKRVGVDEVPVFVPAGTVIPLLQKAALLQGAHVDALHLDLYPGSDGENFLYEDDGRSTDFQSGIYAKTRFNLSGRGRELRLRAELFEGTAFEPSRDLILSVSLEHPPASVSLDGRMLEADSWALGSDGRYVFRIGEVPSSGFEILIYQS